MNFETIQPAGRVYDQRIGVWRLVHLPGHRGPDLRCFLKSSSSSNVTPTQNTVTTQGGASPATVGSGSPVTTGGVAVQGGNLNYTADPVVIAAALDTVNKAVSSLNDQLTGAQNNLGAVISDQAAQAANTASSGQTNTNQTVLYVVIAGVVGLVSLMLFGRKK